MRRTRFTQSSAVVAAAVGLLGVGCAATALPERSGMGFALNVATGATGPMFVQVTNQEDQPGWIHVSHATGGRVYLRARCDIPDCGKPPAVCGAAMPIVRDIAVARRVEFVWDGMESVLDTVAGCESRQRAPAGAYIASFCYSGIASLQGGGDVKTGTVGLVQEPICTDVPFAIPGTNVVSLQVPVPRED